MLYEDLNKLIRSVPRQNKLFPLGDFSARVGTDLTTWKGVIGKNDVGKCNSNGLLLLRTCAAHDFLIKSTVLWQPHRNRTSWMYPGYRHCHLIDFLITRRKDRHDVRVTKVMSQRLLDRSQIACMQTHHLYSIRW